MCTSWPFFAIPCTSAGIGPLISAWITAMFPSAGISSITLTRKFGTAFGNARQNTIDATTDWHDALAAVRSISSECAICAESEHAINVVGIVGSEELLGSRYVVFRIRFHLHRLCSFGSLFLGSLRPSIQTTG